MVFISVWFILCGVSFNSSLKASFVGFSITLPSISPQELFLCFKGKFYTTYLITRCGLRRMDSLREQHGAFRDQVCLWDVRLGSCEFDAVEEHWRWIVSFASKWQKVIEDVLYNPEMLSHPLSWIKEEQRLSVLVLMTETTWMAGTFCS